jgi:putative spermidine/putrescine transport system ATP-binding protein
MLEVAGLAKSWPGFDLELDMEVARGEIVAVLGPSGCGKSSLLRLISGLEQPDAGRIIVEGRDLSGLPPERRGIGMVFQDFALFPHMSVRRNIEFGPRMRRASRAARRVDAEALAASFEIGPLLERSPYSLSGGEQQRVALARSLAAKPSIMLLDEPLSSLDASLRRRLRAEIADRLKAAGMTALIVTHDAEEALAVSDRLYILRAGRVEAAGAPEELYAAPPTAWSASFMGNGPVIEILSMETRGSRLLARTPIGEFLCRSGKADASSLYFPASAPRMGGSGPAPNRLRGRVASVSFAGRYRRVALACPVVDGPQPGGSAIIELDLEPSIRPAPGDLLELDLRQEECIALT